MPAETTQGDTSFDIKKSSHHDSRTPQQGIKENSDKLFYEIDFRFIEAMAKRMAENKSKYPPFNWKKGMDVVQLEQAMFRHIVEVMEHNYHDGDKELDHIIALACNAMMIWYQLKHNQ